MTMEKINTSEEEPCSEPPEALPDRPQDAAPARQAGGDEAPAPETGGAADAAARPLSDGAIAELEEALARAEGDAARHRDDLLRALAELENFRKRSARDAAERERRARQAVLVEFLPAVDDVERALEAIDEAAGEPSSIVDGVKLIHARLLATLAALDVRPLEALGVPFDPNLHEAVAHVESEDVAPDHVAHVLQKGYWIGDTVLRPARVTVARAAPENDA